MAADVDPVVIIGAGLAGLNCARTLHRSGRRFVLYDKADTVGGRVATTTVGGFRCDRGFQVLPTGDTDVRRFLSVSNLHLGKFMSGALIRGNSRWHHLADPRRHPQFLVEQCLGTWGSWTDKWALLRWLAPLFISGPGAIPAGRTIGAELEAHGLDGGLADRFIKPWLRGITLDQDLLADAGAVKAYVTAFMHGPAALPAGGMAAIPASLASELPPASLQLGRTVRAIDDTGIHLADGSTVRASQIVVAVDGPAQHRLLLGSQPAVGKGVSTLHIALPAPAPISQPWLVLPGAAATAIASISFPSLVAQGYAPPGWHLATIAVLDDGRGIDPWPLVQQQLRRLYGRTVDDWYVVRYDRIRNALPAQQPADLSPGHIRRQGHLVLCGDCVSRPGIGPALASGYEAALHVLGVTP